MAILQYGFQKLIKSSDDILRNFEFKMKIFLKSSLNIGFKVRLFLRSLQLSQCPCRCAMHARPLASFFLVNDISEAKSPSALSLETQGSSCHNLRVTSLLFPKLQCRSHLYVLKVRHYCTYTVSDLCYGRMPVQPYGAATLPFCIALTLRVEHLDANMQ